MRKIVLGNLAKLVAVLAAQAAAQSVG